MTTAITCGHLVYVRTLKCASTFYWETFKKLGWNELDFNAIDWKNQRVFSHMMYPDHRRHRGVAKYVEMHDAYDLFYENETFRKFIANIPGLDQHSASYHDQYGNYCNLVDWIPMSGRKKGVTWWLSHEETIAKTNSLLLHYGIKVFNNWAWGQENRSSERHQKLVQDLDDLWCRDQPHWGEWYLQHDRELYLRVTKRFNFDATTWRESSWLGY